MSLILVYWVNPVDPNTKTQFSEHFSNFVEVLDKNRYYPEVVRVVDTLSMIRGDVAVWHEKVRYINCRKTLWIGFQGGPGWELPEFHDILDYMKRVPEMYPDVQVQWLPDNWFDHPGLLPELTSGLDALQWMEQQILNDEPEKIVYNFRGGRND